jgi:hypothetical protein
MDMMHEKTNMLYRFKGLHGCDSCCLLRIYTDGNFYVVIFTELANNPGTSVTNMIETLATNVLRQFLGLDKWSCVRWFEHYPERGDRHHSIQETFDEVTFAWFGTSTKRDPHYESAQWKRSSRSTVDVLVGKAVETPSGVL